MNVNDTRVMNCFKAVAILAAIAPGAAQAQTNAEAGGGFSIEMNLLALLVSGSLLLYGIVLIFVFRTRFKTADGELKDITAELEHTRQRLTETKHTLEKTESNLKNTAERYQGILFDARVGMFQMDRSGACTYINSALQEMSGLYPKKALKEGLQSAIHPDDLKRFEKAWADFMKKEETFALPFRFKLSKGREVHVMCLANKVFNERKDVESYIGWVSDTSSFHEAALEEKARTSRYARFIEETIEGYYHLTPEHPIPLSGPADKVAKTILESLKLTACNDTFSALYGTAPGSLKGKSISALQGGCGPFRNADSIKKLMDADFRLIHIESVRQDPRGNRLSLLNDVIGIVEDNTLVGIWGSHRNISKEKREKEELVSQSRFMHRILDALPADVHVKDTRCRYLYASRKLAQRTGIAQEDWIGKTIFEVLPATPRDHDKNAIEVMKSGKMNRIERSYETRKKSGWMETVQIPLVSDEGLIEGVVGLSFDTSDRKKKEQEILGGQKKVEQQLQRRSQELEKSQNEHSKAVTELRSTRQELRIRETELESQKREFEEQLTDRKRAEDLLRRSEEALLTRQKHLEEQLSTRLDELDTETDKRKKWEELLAIKESELKKLEECVSTRAKELEEEIARRTQTEADLKAGRTDLEQTRRDLKALEQQRTKEISGLTDKHDRAYGEEQTARKAAEKQLKKTATALESAQNRIQTLLEQHATELEHEVAERRNASTKLIQNAEELDELKRKFNERIEEETKALKKELAQKQIHEKALRQQSKDLESRIKELEKTLQLKIKENSKQIEAREGAEVQRQQVEQKLEHLTSRQRQLVERETQKLNLNIAEIRLEEIKLRKVLGELEQEKESLEHQLKERAADLDTSAKEKEKLETALKQAQAQCDTLRQEQQDLVTRETQALRDELKTLKKKESTLLKQEETLRQSSQDLKDSIKELSTKLTAETRNRQSVEKELEELQVAFTEGQENLASMIKEETKELSGQIEQHRQNEVRFKEAEQALRKEAEALQKTMDARAAELEDARKQCEKAELELVQVVERSSKGAKEIEAQIAGIKDEHQAEIKRIRDEQKEIRKKENYYRSLIQGSSDAFLQLDLKTGKVQFANLAAARLFGEETTKALTGKTMDALSPEHQAENALSADLVKARLHSALETGHESYEWQFNAVGQEPLHSLVSLSTVEIEENQVILALITDVSHLKKQQEDLQRSIAEAHEANRMNSRVVDEVTESVQEKLDPVVEATQLIEKAENLSEEQQHDMALINRNCRSLIDTMNYRRELSHVADGSNELTPEKCDLHEMIKELDQQFTHRAETKKIFFAVSYAQYQSANNVPKFVEADEHKVRTVLSILLGYALARTEKGRLGLHAARKSGQDDMISVGFELAYTGIEKKDELLSKVFDSENTGIEDMQYGLTLARRYVQMMDGHIELDYRQGDVTALTIELPFRKVASEILMPGKDDEAEAGAA